jgi:hypothetical protein
MAAPYRDYRATFSLYWLCSLLVETIVLTIEHGLIPASEIEEEANHAIHDAAAQIGSAGRIPIVLASEFNLK